MPSVTSFKLNTLSLRKASPLGYLSFAQFRAEKGGRYEASPEVSNEPHRKIPMAGNLGLPKLLVEGRDVSGYLIAELSPQHNAIGCASALSTRRVQLNDSELSGTTYIGFREARSPRCGGRNRARFYAPNGGRKRRFRARHRCRGPNPRISRCPQAAAASR